MDFCRKEEQPDHQMAMIEVAEKELRTDLIDRNRQGELMLESITTIKKATANSMGSEFYLKCRSVDG